MSSDIENRTDLRTLCEILVNDYTATFIAAAEQSLANRTLTLVFHTAPGTNPAYEQLEELYRRFDHVDSIRFDGEEMPIQLRHVLHTEVHAYHRVPIYVKGQPGLENISLNEGIDTVRDFLSYNHEPIPSPSKSIRLPALVEELANSGAAAVELRNESLIEFDLVDLRIPMIPAKGYPIAAPYDSVTINGKSHDLRFDCVLEGPGGYGLMHTPIYVDSTTIGLQPVSVPKGVQNFDSVQTIVETSNSTQEAYDQLREASEKWMPR